MRNDTKISNKSREGLVFSERHGGKQTKNETAGTERKKHQPLKIKELKEYEVKLRQLFTKRKANFEHMFARLRGNAGKEQRARAIFSLYFVFRWPSCLPSLGPSSSEYSLVALLLLVSPLSPFHVFISCYEI